MFPKIFGACRRFSNNYRSFVPTTDLCTEGIARSRRWVCSAPLPSLPALFRWLFSVPLPYSSRLSPLSERLEQTTHYLNAWNRLPTIWTTGTGYPLCEGLEQATHYLNAWKRIPLSELLEQATHYLNAWNGLIRRLIVVGRDPHVVSINERSWDFKGWLTCGRPPPPHPHPSLRAGRLGY